MDVQQKLHLRGQNEMESSPTPAGNDPHRKRLCTRDRAQRDRNRRPEPIRQTLRQLLRLLQRRMAVTKSHPPPPGCVGPAAGRRASAIKISSARSSTVSPPSPIIPPAAPPSLPATSTP